MNIADAITEQATKRPEHVAIEDGKRRVTYADFDARVDNAAGNLQAAQVAPGETVVIFAGDSADHLTVICALARVGVCIFAISPRLPPAEIALRMEGVNPVLAITDDGPAPVDELPCLTFAGICRPAPRPGERFEAGVDHPLILSQSSGTTGRPKSFVRSHGQLQERFVRYSRGLGWSADDRYLAVMSMAFDMGRTICLGMLSVGATVVIKRAGSPGEMATQVRDKAITFLHITPMHLQGLSSLSGQPTPLLPDLRAIFVGAAPVTNAQRQLARQRIAPNIVETFGTNEVGLISTLPPAEQDTHPDAVGRIIEGVEAEIVDEQDTPLPPDSLGLLRFRVAMPPTSYLNDPEASAIAFRHGWFYPGDVAILSADGYFFLKGRADDVINNAGAKFYPIEVETALKEHPEVIEAAAMGWPHARVGEVVVAVVATQAPVEVETLQNFCKTRLAGFKVPQLILFLPELPKSDQGKVRKAELKDLIEQEVVRQRDAG